MTQERDRRVQFFSHFGSDGAGLPHRACACAGGATRGTTARRAPHAREHIRTRGGPSESSDEATRAGHANGAKANGASRLPAPERRPAFGGSAEEDDEASPPPSAGRLRRARRRVRASSMRFDARSVARRRPRRPRRSASRACRPSARLRRANALQIPRRAPAQAHCRCFFPSPPVQRRRREADAGANARVETSGRIRRRATWRTRRRGTSRPSTSATGATTPSGETRCGKRPHFPFPALSVTRTARKTRRATSGGPDQIRPKFFPRPLRSPAGVRGVAHDGNPNESGHTVTTGVPNGSAPEISYETVRVVGNGSFGVVFQATCVQTGDTVAIKKVLQDKRFKNRELQIMRVLEAHQRCEAQALLLQGDQREGGIVSEPGAGVCARDRVSHRAKHYSKAKTSAALARTSSFTLYQMAARARPTSTALGVCHRDIKPQNLLVNTRTHQIVKLCDFGSAKILVGPSPTSRTSARRYYRAPELIFGSTDYTTAIDIWSLGCVMAELAPRSASVPRRARGVAARSWRSSRCWAPRSPRSDARGDPRR